MSEGAEVLEINGPMVTVHLPGVANGEQVLIGARGLVGEVIAREGDHALVQCYEATDTLKPGEAVRPLGHPLSVELGPGLIGRIFDGVQRPLEGFVKDSGWSIPRGVRLDPLDRQRQWAFQPGEVAAGAHLAGGSVLGTVQETASVEHRILVPPDIAGELVELAAAGDYTIDQPIARLRDGQGRVHDLRLFHRWPVRTPRPHAGRTAGAEPLLTGQRILDTFFPLLKGGKAAVPGPFGAGKTMLQQQIARWANTRIVIYVGCGERGNELVDILDSFPKLTDPHTGRSLMERTLLVANTSNMPVVAREASIYVGITIAEYFRDQGHDVVLVADSTSRWAEALREVAGRLGQMPVEEGYPAYLASRLAAFYERAGQVGTLSGAKGSVTLIGAVSPPGGDFSEPVTSHTKDIIDTFWALSKDLADARHYPAVDWNESFAAHVGRVAGWWADAVSPDWQAKRAEALSLLAEAEDYARVANLVGPEALSPRQRWALEGAGLIKDGVLQQHALDPVDSYCAPERQFLLVDLMLALYRHGAALLDRGVPVQQLLRLPLLTQARRWKGQFGNDKTEELAAMRRSIDDAFADLGADYAEARGDAESEIVP